MAPHFVIGEENLWNSTEATMEHVSCRQNSLGALKNQLQ